MVKNSFNFIVLLGLVFMMSLGGCIFKPDGENYLKIDSVGSVPSVVVDLNFAWNCDTVYICKDETVTFSYRSNSDKINWAKFEINGKETHAYTPDEYGSFQFYFCLPDFLPGIYPMSMTICTHSQTGSLADVAGAEGFLLKKEWILVITDQYSMSPRITRTSFTDGKLKIEWSPFRGIGFKYGKLYKEIPYLANSRVLVTTITDQNQTEYSDSTYHGESSAYYWVVNDTYRSQKSLVSGPLPQLSAANRSNGTFVLKWNVPPFYKNLKGYQITYHDDISGEYYLMADINNPNTDSCVVLNPVIGYKYDFLLTIIPLTNNYYDEIFRHMFLSSKLTAYFGTASPKFYWTDQGSKPLIYMLYAGNVLVFNAETNRVDTTLYSNPSLFRYSISENNRYMVSVVSGMKSIYFNDVYSISNSKPVFFTSSYPTTASVANNGTGVVILGNKAVLYDFLYEKCLGEVALTNDFLSINKISPSGTYFVASTYSGYEFFAFKENRVERLPDWDESIQDIMFVEYLPGTREKLVVVTSQIVALIDCDTWSVVSKQKFQNSITTVFNFDFSSHKLFLCTDQDFLLLNIETGKEEILFPTIPNQRINWWDLIYCNKQIFWGGGLKTNIGY